MHLDITGDWQQARAETFWKSIAPNDHVVQFYDSDEAFMQALAGFAGVGINAGEAVVIIATPDHIQRLEKIFRSLGVNTRTLIAEGRYIPVNASELLEQFMVNDWPDEALFQKATAPIMAKARARNRKVRVFGEMVSLLMERGLTDATVYLESIWKKISESENLSIFCAYPRNQFTDAESLAQVCSCHHKEINGESSSMTTVNFRHS